MAITTDAHKLDARALEAQKLEAEKLDALAQAHTASNADDSLPDILRHTLDVACSVANAAFGAIARRGPHAELVDVLWHGVADTAAIATWSTSAPLMAEIAAGATVRIDDLAADPRRADVPAGHPEMHGFLGVPITARDQTVAVLYLANPHAGRFADNEVELVSALAVGAGTAIDRLKAAEEAEQSREWLRAAGEISRALIADVHEDLLDGIVQTACRVSRSDHCALLLPTASGGLSVEYADGPATDAYLGHVFEPHDGQLVRAASRGIGMLVEHISSQASREYPAVFEFGPAMLVPLIDLKGVRGAFLFLRDEGALPFTHTDLDDASTFAGQVALGLELADARTDAESLRVLRDRHRIAKDLHDNVMQRLFAAGLRLQMIDPESVPDEAGERLQVHMTELDETIRQIRTTIFELRESDDVDRISVAHLPSEGPAVTAGGTEQAQ